MKLSAKIRKTFEGETNLRAFADLIVDGGLVVKGVKVMQNKEGGLFVAMPSEKVPGVEGQEDKYYDTVKPLSKEVRQQIEGAVFSEYANVRNKEMTEENSFDGEFVDDEYDGEPDFD
jgi:Uncharacterized protein, involved in the regulation of septum location